MITVRRDKNALVLFSTANGTKLRLAIGPYVKATRPELVDIKITDHCDYGCSFCYQGSTPLGKHASITNLEYVIDELHKARVFEVAIGGGEPTDHPQFVDILGAFHDVGIVPNFTTKYPARVRKLWPEIRKYVGGFAYSAESPLQIAVAAHHFELAGIPHSRVNLHYVMGLHNRETFSDYMKTAERAGLRVTLLGYKTTGRGGDHAPFDYRWWVDEISDLVAAGLCPSLSVDTPLAAEFDGMMPVGKALYHTREGAFSMYVDAVNLTFGASSYDALDELQPFGPDWREKYLDM